MKKILIVGGTSTLGKYLKEYLSGSYEILTAGRKNCDVIFDLGDSSSNFKIPDDLDVVINTASQFGGHSDEQILETETINVLGTLKLCQASVRTKAKHFIFISSIYSSFPRNSGNFNIYALSKKHAEEVAELYCSTHGMSLTIIRPCPLYGTHDGFRVHQPFFYSIIDKAERGEDIPLFGTNDPVRNYLYIDDLLEVISRVISGKTEGVYSCCHTADTTYSQIANAAFAAFQSNGKVYYVKDKPNIPDIIFDKDLTIYEKINFFPRISIGEGIKKIAESRIH